MIMCSNCKKRPAVVFITSVQGNEKKNEGLCLSCAREKKIPQVAENGGYSSSAAVTDSYNKIIAETPLAGNEIYLKAEFLFNTVDENLNVSYNLDKADFYYSYDGNSWNKL